MAIRNFPHQVNAIPKLRAALQVASEILQRGEDLHDDGIYGYAVVRSRVYTFRGLSEPTDEQLEQRIAEEQIKSASNQGPRTFARDLRRTLLLLGFLELDEQGNFCVSESGSRLLSLSDLPHEESKLLWINAVLGVELPSDVHGISPLHPALNMLRIIARVPDVEKRWLAFALDMADDSDEELNRVLDLIETGNFDSARESVEASEFDAANAVKILPALLEQIDLIRIDSGRCQLTELGESILDERYFIATTVKPPFIAPKVRARRRSPRDGYTIYRADEIKRHERERGIVRTREDQIHSALLLDERTTEHQKAVCKLVEALRNVTNIKCSEDAFDVLAISQIEDLLLLFEVKTIRKDSLAQARIAVGQLLFYEFFDVIPIASGRKIVKVAVFDDEPGDDVRSFLNYNGIYCIAILKGGISVPPELRNYFV